MVERPPHRVPRCARCEVTNAIKRNTQKKRNRTQVNQEVLPDDSVRNDVLRGRCR